MLTVHLLLSDAVCKYLSTFCFSNPQQNIHFSGQTIPMPPELMELYTLYQQELETSSKNEKETKLISDLNIMMRVKNL